MHFSHSLQKIPSSFWRRLCHAAQQKPGSSPPTSWQGPQFDSSKPGNHWMVWLDPGHFGTLPTQYMLYYIYRGIHENNHTFHIGLAMCLCETKHTTWIEQWPCESITFLCSWKLTPALVCFIEARTPNIIEKSCFLVWSNLVKAKVVASTKLLHPQLLQWLVSGLDQLLLIDLAWINLRKASLGTGGCVLHQHRGIASSHPRFFFRGISRESCWPGLKRALGHSLCAATPFLFSWSWPGFFAQVWKGSRSQPLRKQSK